MHLNLHNRPKVCSSCDQHSCGYFNDQCPKLDLTDLDYVVFAIDICSGIVDVSLGIDLYLF